MFLYFCLTDEWTTVEAECFLCDCNYYDLGEDDAWDEDENEDENRQGD